MTAIHSAPTPAAGKGPLRLALGLSPAVKVSLLLQAAALPFLLLPQFRWPVLFWIVGQHAILAIAGTVPRSRLLGPNTLDGDHPGVALTFDDGPDPEVTPRVLDLLAERSAVATFFVIGERAERHPELIRRMLAEGHAVENHTHSHSWWFWSYPPRRLLRELTTAQQALVAAGAPPPTRFRAPAGVRSPWLQPILGRTHLELTSWSRRGFDTSESDSETVLERLEAGLFAGSILLLHDGNSARTESGTAVVLEVLPRLLDRLTERQLGTCLLDPTEGS